MDKRIKYGLVLIESVVLLCVLLVMGGATLPIYQQYNNLNKQKYDMVYQYSNDVDFVDSYYMLDGVLAYKRGKGFKAEMLMQKATEYSSVAPFGLVDSLEKNEIVVTENILDLIGKNVGDTVEFYNPIYDLYVDYVIADKVDSVFGLYEDNVNAEFGVVILGYDETIPEMANLKSVLFATDSLKASETGMDLDWSYNKSETAKSIMEEYVIRVLVIIVALVLLLFAFLVAYVVFAYPRLAKMYRMGSSQKTLKVFIKNNYFIPNVIATVISSILWGIVHWILNGTMVAGMFFAFIPCLVIMMIGENVIKSIIRRRN